MLELLSAVFLLLLLLLLPFSSVVVVVVLKLMSGSLISRPFTTFYHFINRSLPPYQPIISCLSGGSKQFVMTLLLTEYDFDWDYLFEDLHSNRGSHNICSVDSSSC